MKICKIKGCENKHYARGWCSKHYQRWWMHDDPLFIKHKTHEMHGYTKHPLYKVWDAMKQRCYNENCRQYKYYGGRGIIVCNEWKNSPKTFIEWALLLWKEGLLIDRINNNGNYKPSNCHFVTYEESNLNKKLLQNNNTSGYRGVSYFKRDKKWAAYININNKKKHLGYFNTPKLAARAYNNVVIDNRPKNFNKERIKNV